MARNYTIKFALLSTLVVSTSSFAGNSLYKAAYNTPIIEQQDPAPIIEITAHHAHLPLDKGDSSASLLAQDDDFSAKQVDYKRNVGASSISYVLLTNISFAGEQVELSAQQISEIDNAISRINHGANDQLSVLVTAHADDSGDDARNLELSHARANSVASYLKKQGVIENVIRTHSFGRASPRNENWHENGRQYNRRVSITLIQSNSAIPPI